MKTKKAKRVKKARKAKNQGVASSSTNRNFSVSVNGREVDPVQCFADMVSKTKKFNKAQTELRRANRIKR